MTQDSNDNEIEQRLKRLESEFTEFRDSTKVSMTRLEQLNDNLVGIVQLYERALKVLQQKHNITDAAIQALVSHSEVVNRNLDQLIDDQLIDS